MFKNKTLVKICGITSIEQAIQIAELGTNAIGIISINQSPRYISPKKKKTSTMKKKKAIEKIVENENISPIKEIKDKKSGWWQK